MSKNQINNNQLKGRAEEAEGKVKEAVGVLLDDKDMQIKGNVQKNGFCRKYL